MKIFKLIFKNALRHKLRTALTIMGIGIAVIAFSVLRTFVTAWYYGVEGSQADRLITRHAVSFINPLPYSYLDKLKQVPGVEAVSYFNWFGGVYIDKNQFFPRFACDPNTAFELYPEYVLEPDEIEAFKRERNACILGRDIADQYDLKIGDVMVLEGDIYPGRWEFTVRGIYEPKYEYTDGTAMLFSWDYLNERIHEEYPERANAVGWYVIKIENPKNAGNISNRVDALFKNSANETITETERAFQQSFIAASSAIIEGMNAISFIIVGIIMFVLANTMIMAARERTREYAVFKTLGFSKGHLVGLILGESLLISALGGAFGLALTFPLVNLFESVMPKNWFPVFTLEPVTLILCIGAVLIIGVLSSIFPIHKAVNTKIIEGLRFVG